MTNKYLPYLVHEIEKNSHEEKEKKDFLSKKFTLKSRISLMIFRPLTLKGKNFRGNQETFRTKGIS